MASVEGVPRCLRRSVLTGRSVRVSPSTAARWGRSVVVASGRRRGREVIKASGVEASARISPSSGSGFHARCECDGVARGVVARGKDVPIGAGEEPWTTGMVHEGDASGGGFRGGEGEGLVEARVTRWGEG